MPLFSILLPSRDRLNLLQLAIPTILQQDFRDFEIVISDNASSDDYQSYIIGLSDPRIKYLKTTDVISVTANWNNALRAATGTYVLMLGDDDALTPGLLTKLAKLVKGFGRPDVIYMKAYHYLYPGVNKDAEGGYLREIINSPLFLPGGEPYQLDIEQAQAFARAAVSFQHLVSFNAQHFLWRRDFTQTKEHRFFEPPYPDYFACFYTFARAKKIVVVTDPSVIIGISKQSFGYFFLNNRQAEGARAFAGEILTAADLAASDRMEIENVLRFPGPDHYRNWLLTSLQFINLVEKTFKVDFDKYRKIQIVETLSHCFSQSSKADTSLVSLRNEWKPQWSFVRHAWSRMMPGIKSGQVDQFRSEIIIGELEVYFPAAVKNVAITTHSNILDAFKHLQGSVGPTSLSERCLNIFKKFRFG